jgi:hypothetical protein
MRPGRIVMLVLGTLSALLGLGLLAGAGVAGWANYQQRDNGYFTTPSGRFAADSYALTSPRLGLMARDRFSDSAAVNVPGSIVIRGSAADPTRPIFIGIAPQAEVAAYLADVKHSEVTDVRFSPFRAQYLAVPGSRTPPQPAAQAFWTASATGAGAQELKWDLRSGDWALVIMNADAGTPVAVDLQAGVRSDLLWPIFVGLLIGGLLLLAVGVPLIVAGAAGLGRGMQGSPGPPPTGVLQQPGRGYGSQDNPDAGRTQAYGVHGFGMQDPWPGSAGQPAAGGRLPAAPAHAAAPYPGAAHPAMPQTAQPYPSTPYPQGPPPGAGGLVYPARLSGYLDPNLSRWLWLVKWLLAIPHFIILFFLWFALIVVTIAAWFAILLTARYPRSLFNFSVGVIRWHWRVSFYAYGALGTDRYPPFTLARTDYPADFDVDYPERLSRGLVLVKSWLLAFPQLLVVAVLTGTARTWTVRDGVWVQEGGGISLLGLLVFIAGVILLFTGQYWRGLFDLVLGLNRWIYRVITYVALLRDEYPPFHLDMGPLDPGDARAGPDAGPPAEPAALRPEARNPEPQALRPEGQDPEPQDRGSPKREAPDAGDRPAAPGPAGPGGPDGAPQSGPAAPPP